MSRPMNGAQLLIALLQEQGIATVTGIPGGNILPFYDALGQSSLQHVLARSEQGAAFIAQGMARVSGNPAVCIATSGPGATNLLTGIADAFRDSIPVIAITGQVPRAHIGTQAFQEIDIASMATHCTKATFRIGSAQELSRAIPEAFAIAAQGRPGPVWIDIPKDVFLEPCQPLHFGMPPRIATPMAPDATLQAASAAIALAERPLLYLGGGMQSHEAAAALAEFQAQANIPAIGTLLSLGCMSTDDPLWLGMVGMHGTPYANLALDRTDLLIVAGARFDDRATGNLQAFAPNAAVIHIDCDAKELGRLRRASIAIRADVSDTLRRLARQIPQGERPQWLAELTVLALENPMPAQIAHTTVAQIAMAAPQDALIATDVGQHQMWTAQAWPFRKPRRWLTSGGLGTMGFGLPAAIGASLAQPERTTVCISGDGSILMNIQEMATLAETGANVKICLFDNGGLGMVRQQQNLLLAERYFACQFAARPDFVAIAQGFGIAATDAENDDNWQRLLQQPGPALVRFPISEEETVWPMVPGGRANSEMLLPCTQKATAF